MSDYTQIVDFSVKDGLATGNPAKLIKGSEMDAELAAISTAIASKYDDTDVASQAEAEAETVDNKLITPLKLANWSDANGGMVGDLQGLADPNADRLLFWDDSESAAALLTVGTGLSITTTTMSVNEAAVNHDNLAGFVANEHINHTSVSITAGSGLTGGGDISATRTINVGAGTGISVAADTVGLDTANNRNVDHGSVQIIAGLGLTGGGAITANRTLNIGAGTGMTVNADDIALNLGSQNDWTARQDFEGGIQVGDDATNDVGRIPQVLYGSVFFDPPSIVGHGRATTTLTITGAAVDDPCTVIGTGAIPTGGIVYQAYCNTANTVTIVAENVTAGSINPTGQDIHVIVWRGITAV